MSNAVPPVRSLFTMTFVNVMLPEFLTVPVKVSVPPGLVGTDGQFSVIAMLGAVPSEHVADALLVTNCEVQALVPRATTVLLTEQALSGAVNVAVKLVVAPGARLATVNTVPGEVWLLTTVTPFKVTLPELLTLPL